VVPPTGVEHDFDRQRCNRMNVQLTPFQLNEAEAG
jgi:hypothetical protein